jgi:large subunit ribosomal protein L15
MLPINLGKLQDFVDMGRLSTERTLTMKDLVEAGVATMSSVKHGMKLLAKGKERLRSPLKLEVSRASQSAIEALEAVGGEVTTVHFNRLALRALLKPHKFDLLPKRARPPPKLLPYYTNYKNRGYLSLEVQLKNMNLQLGNLDVSNANRKE